MIRNFLLFSSFLLYISAAPTPFGCTSPHQNITVTTVWMLPPTPLAPGENCNIKVNCLRQRNGPVTSIKGNGIFPRTTVVVYFKSSKSKLFMIPSGFFAVADIIANGIPDVYNSPDTFDIYDDYGNRIEINNHNGTLHSNVAWPLGFIIRFRTSKNTQMTLQMSITLQKVVNNNIVLTFSSGLNTQSSVLYLNEWKEGDSIVVTSQSNRTQLFSAMAYGSSDEYNNIFVYSSGKLIGTMLQTVMGGPVDSYGPILLYMARQISLKGVVLAVDYSNLEGLRDFTVQYVPLGAQGQTAMVGLNSGWDYAPVGVSVIGDHDGSTPVDVRSFYTDGEGQISYLQGGPTEDFATRGVSLERNKLPLHLMGNINTFFNTVGAANVKITVSS